MVIVSKLQVLFPLSLECRYSCVVTETLDFTDDMRPKKPYNSCSLAVSDLHLSNLMQVKCFTLDHGWIQHKGEWSRQLATGPDKKQSTAALSSSQVLHSSEYSPMKNQSGVCWKRSTNKGKQDYCIKKGEVHQLNYMVFSFMPRVFLASTTRSLWTWLATAKHLQGMDSILWQGKIKTVRNF